MTFIEHQNLYLFLYKTFSLLVGLAIVFLGYRLFINGIYSGGGDFRVNGKQAGGDSAEVNFSLIGAAPGSLFALFGMFIIGFTVIKGLKYSGVIEHQNNNAEHVELFIPDPDENSEYVELLLPDPNENTDNVELLIPNPN